jgi:hypothetical protein
MDEPAEDSWKEALRSYIHEHGDDLTFTKHFWKECEPLESDVTQYNKFVRAQQAAYTGDDAPTISLDFEVSTTTIRSWLLLEKMPKLAHFLKAFLKLGLPDDNHVWLTLEQSHGYAIPVGQFIRIPKILRSWEDAEPVLPQIKPLLECMPQFSRRYLFGFLLGIILGDAHKPKQGHSHRHIDLVLSKKYETNQRIGDFTCSCANQFGLRMKRYKDKPKPKDKPHGFYEWASQSSPFVDWIFQVCLGLEDGQNTTYNLVTMEWTLDAPLDFRVGLIQGIAESDGSVAVASQAVEFWVLPDWEFVIRLLSTFGLHGFHNREAVSLVKTQAINSFSVPVFSEHLQTARYQKLKLMATTKKLTREERLPETVRSEIQRLARQGYSVPKIVEEIARSKSLLVSFEAAQRWAKKTKANVPTNPETEEFDAAKE